MVVGVLLDSNVYLGYRYQPDHHHEDAHRVVDGLEAEYTMTRSAALEVAQISREKLDAIVTKILVEPTIRDGTVSIMRKEQRLKKVLDELEQKRSLGTFRTLVERFCEAEFSKGHDTLSNLPEWAHDTVDRIIPDLKEFCGTDDLLKLPGTRTEGDMEFIAECGVVIGEEAISGFRDRQIFYDSLVHARIHRGMRFGTFDRTFASEAKKALQNLTDADLVEEDMISFHDLNVEGIPE